MSIKKMFLIIYTVTVLAILGLCVATVLMLNAQKALNESQEIRYKSYQVANELSQNSQNLTRLARTYVVTGDEKYEKQYWELVDISDGKKPRKDGRTISFAQMMKELHFTDEEFAKIQGSKEKSQELVKTEEKAMNAVKGLYPDPNGNYTVHGTPDPEMARRILHDDNYHRQVSIILEPINDFFKMLDERTQNEVNSHIADSYFYLYLIGAIIMILLVTQIINFFIIRKKVNKPIDALSNATGKIAAGDMSVVVDYKSKDEIGQLSMGFNLMIGKIK
ncbi:MAG: HAMP domain-containing protein, partial [Syntrophomonadaceae bacterium]